MLYICQITVFHESAIGDIMLILISNFTWALLRGLIWKTSCCGVVRLLHQRGRRQEPVPGQWRCSSDGR